MSDWFDSRENEFPNNKQNYQNYLVTNSNVYLGLIEIETQRKKKKLVVEPIYLWLSPEHLSYWGDAYMEKVSPVKWRLMPTFE